MRRFSAKRILMRSMEPMGVFFMLNALIEKIVVHEKTVGENGEKEQTVDIYYRFVGKID